MMSAVVYVCNHSYVRGGSRRIMALDIKNHETLKTKLPPLKKKKKKKKKKRTGSV
jgi:hypothetical protein